MELAFLFLLLKANFLIVFGQTVYAKLKEKKAPLPHRDENSTYR